MLRACIQVWSLSHMHASDMAAHTLLFLGPSSMQPCAAALITKTCQQVTQLNYCVSAVFEIHMCCLEEVEQR